jgi:dienelactone hydrolase
MQEKNLHRNMRAAGLAVAVFLMTLLTNACDGDSGGKSYLPASSLSLETTTEMPPGIPEHRLYRPDNLAVTGKPLPVIVWGSGGCFPIDGPWQSLLSRWASAGFVAIAPAVPLEQAATAPRTKASDQAAVIDWVFAENERHDSPYAGRFDLDRVVAAGNSCGGIISLELASMDSRVAAVFILSGSSNPPGSTAEHVAAVMGNVMVPLGYVSGGPEDLSRARIQLDYGALPVGVPAFVARRFEGDHQTVSVNPDILLEVADISVNWIDFALYANTRLRQTLLNKPCSFCEPGVWEVEAKNLKLHVGP